MNLDFAEKLIGNIGRYLELEREELPYGLCQEGLMKYLHSKTNAATRIMNENVAIVQNSLRPMLTNPSLTEFGADDFFTLAQELFTLQKSLDMGLSLEIHKELAKWAKANEDIDREIRSHYWAGIAYHQFNDRRKRLGNEGLMRRTLAHFQAGAAFKDQYFNIESKETRMYINRCLGNIYIIHQNRSSENDMNKSIADFKKAYAAAISFWNDEKVRGHDPDFPWEAFITNAAQNICTWIAMLRVQPPHERDMELAQMVYEGYEHLTQHDTTNYISKWWPKSRSGYVGINVRYIMNEISLDAAIEELYEIYDNSDRNDYSTDGLFVNITVPVVIIHLLEASDQATKEEIEKEAGIVINQMANFCKSIPSGVDRWAFNRHIAVAANYFSKALSFDHYLDMLLNLTTYTHMHTYVHSSMVKMLTQTLAAHFIEHEPEQLIGICETKTAEDVRAKSDEIVELLGRAALCHDIGKVSFMDAVVLTSRPLYDFEFATIKEHTSMSKLIKAENHKMKLIRDVIGGHHMWYDCKGGYYNGLCRRSNRHKFALYLVSVADSIDAATDSVGRSYAKAKTLAQVTDEIQNQAGTRYCPTIAQALKNPNLIKKIQAILDKQRQNLYHQAYNHVRT